MQVKCVVMCSLLMCSLKPVNSSILTVMYFDASFRALTLCLPYATQPNSALCAFFLKANQVITAIMSMVQYICPVHVLVLLWPACSVQADEWRQPPLCPDISMLQFYNDVVIPDVTLLLYGCDP